MSKNNRRDFLSKLIAGWAALFFLPIIYGIVDYVIPPILKEKLFSSVTVPNAASLAPNTVTKTRVNKTPIVLVSNEQGQLKAFNARCTHLGCVIAFEPDKHDFYCECHGSRFTMDGKNIEGPAPKPLQQLKVQLKGQDAIISVDI